MSIEVGKNYSLNKKTFLLKGVFVFSKSMVEVTQKNSDDTYTILYTDREGFQHNISDIREEELV